MMQSPFNIVKKNSNDSKKLMQMISEESKNEKTNPIYSTMKETFDKNTAHRILTSN
jgi:hypothetical protein